MFYIVLGTKTFGGETGNFALETKTPPAISRGNSGRGSKPHASRNLEPIAADDNKPGVKTGYLIPVASLSKKERAERNADIDLVRSLQ